MPLADTSFDLADACDGLVTAIADGRRKELWFESPGQAMTLNQQIMSLGDAADNLRTAGVAASLEKATSAVTAIDNAASQAKSAVKALKRAEQAITLAGSLISLAASAAIGDVPGIAKSAQAVISEVNQLQAPD